ncbi:MAG: hypothetical protein WC428_01975 [Candidatus Paceibacterota bacterium]
MKKIGFIVKTDAYAGNFEREMCAYMTGQIGECEVGKSYVDQEEKSLLDKLFHNILSLPDDNGCYRPVSILSGDTYFDLKMPQNEKSNSLVIYFDDQLTEVQIEELKKRAYEFPQVWEDNRHVYVKHSRLVKVLGFMIVENETTSKIIIL